MQELSEVVDALVGEVVVKVLPREVCANETTGLERLAGFDDLKVGDVNVAVLGHVEVLFGNQDSLCIMVRCGIRLGCGCAYCFVGPRALVEVLVDCLAVLLAYEHDGNST